MSHKLRHENLLWVPAIAGYLAVSASGISDMAGTGEMPVALVLLAVFGLAYLPPFKCVSSSWLLHLRVAVAVAAVGGLMILRPGIREFPILLFLLGPQIMMIFPTRVALTWVGVATLMTLVIFVGLDGLPGLLPFLLYASGYTFFAIFGWVLVQSENNRRLAEQLFAELQQAHQQLQDYTTRVEELTVVQERNRIAREMHDSLGHRLTIASVQLEGAQRLVQVDPERAVRILTTVREQVSEGLQELRRTVAMLRASIAEDMPLGQALQKLVQQVEEATAVEISLDMDASLPELPAPYRLALYRAAQEGLTNIQRHARARQAWIHLYPRHSSVVLLVSDNGAGMPEEGPSQGSYGLTGLRERAQRLNGSFSIDPRPGGGTQLTFCLPLPQPEEG
ncbi:MAG: sensor histidine kinase [Chloroflexi bacterium]|nr:sensor histidine kinase [Chloroflexota bacterium]